jgi:predicted Fe-S protein YdhL (DUF1289 family)
MARLTEHAAALGKQGAKKKWEGVSDSERRRIMELVRAAKQRKPKMSDNFAIAEAIFKRQNQRTRGGR